MSLAQAILTGEIRALAKGATAIEAQSGLGQELSRELFVHTGRAITLGVTGAPGAGKSTLVNCLIRAFRLAGQTVGVIAVDPSSPYSNGALLGDRIRMLEHHADNGVFIRSVATRGRLGGLASSTLDLCLMMDAAGRDVVVIETVGVGQDEIDIAHMAQVTVLVMAPGAGDDIQVLKAGILEVADVIVINKADLSGADRLKEQIMEAQQLLGGAGVPVCKVIATTDEGIKILVESIRRTFDGKKGQDATELWMRRLQASLRAEILAGFDALSVTRHANCVSQKIEDPWTAIHALKKEWHEGKWNAR